MARLFFALWPEAALQNALAKAANEIVRACDGRAIPPENLHVTLAFLGSVPAVDIGRVKGIAIEVATEFKGKRASVALDAAEYWKKPHLLCATARGRTRVRRGRGAAARNRPDHTAFILAETLKSRLTTAGFAPDLKPFRPHVTLARKVAHSIRTTDMSPIVWEFDDFALIESQPAQHGSMYRVLWRFHFGNAAPPAVPEVPPAPPPEMGPATD